MKFNIAITNPPYNKGMDIDFVDFAYRLSTDYVVAITPAKWQTAEDNHHIISNISYGEFRKLYSTHMKYICFYPACKDIFNILQVDGITFYIMDKKAHDRCIVENRSLYNKPFNSIQTRSISNRETLVNVGNDIIKYLGSYKRFKFNHINYTDNFQVWTNSQVAGGGLSTQVSERKTLFVGESYIQRATDNSHKDSTACKCTFSSNNIDECKSFVSWLNCKFTRFFVAINMCKLTGILTNDSFRFVPAPPSEKFDHIYTDEELYKAFNLPQKYIDIIESIVKERK